MSRQADRQRFLADADWADAVTSPLAGDASSRRYERLRRAAGETAVFMDASPETSGPILPFIRIAEHLRSLRFSAPRILAADREKGFILLEDLGDDLFARLIERDPEKEVPLYRASAELLAQLHRHPAPIGLPPYGPPQMAAAVDVAVTWYSAGCGVPHDAATVARLGDVMLTSLRAISPAPPVLALRDFHAENLLWLPGRDGAARVGLLDFQDAFAGHPAYDIVSLVEDARRDVSDATREATLSRYLACSGADPDTFALACATLGAQRNLRILGVFARLSMHYGKPHYVDLIPRVWRHLQRDLMHPALSELSVFVHTSLPEPTMDRLQRIKEKSATCPTP